MSKALRVGLAGLGVVGTEVATRLLAGALEGVELVAVSARNTNRKRDVDLSTTRFVADATELATADDVDVVVELIGGQGGIAHALVRASLQAGKPVVTANKAMLALCADELSALSVKAGVPLAYEAAIAGGIPVVKVVREGLAGNTIQRLGGILNGTCNYILSRMESAHLSFGDALAEAQSAGFAEADPTLDISGMDAAQKLALLAALAFDVRPDIDNLDVEGITHITAQDISFAAHFDYVIRLIAIAEKQDDKFYMRVAPMLVDASTSLAQTKLELNAVFIDAHPLGRLIMQGAGAGGGATASAVLADIADIAAGHGRPMFACTTQDMRESSATLPPETAWYLRLGLADKPGSMAQITQVLAENGVSIEEVVQRSNRGDDSFLPIVFITHKASPQAVAEVIASLSGRGDICTDILHLPVYGRTEL